MGPWDFRDKVLFLAMWTSHVFMFDMVCAVFFSPTTQSLVGVDWAYRSRPDTAAAPAGAAATGAGGGGGSGGGGRGGGGGAGGGGGGLQDVAQGSRRSPTGIRSASANKPAFQHSVLVIPILKAAC